MSEVGVIRFTVHAPELSAGLAHVLRPTLTHKAKSDEADNWFVARTLCPSGFSLAALEGSAGSHEPAHVRLRTVAWQVFCANRTIPAELGNTP